MTDSRLDFDRIQEIPDGSLVVFRFHDPEVADLGKEAGIADLRVLLNNAGKSNCGLVVLSSDDSLEVLDEQEMGRLGWVRR